MSTPGEPGERVEREEIVEERSRRYGVVRMVNGIIRFATGLFAVVLAIHIALVVGEANMGNGFAQFISGWADGLGLGLANLFTPDNEKLQVALNEGIAALLWLLIGIGLTALIARILTPDGGRRVYRRTVR
ncbi:MAG: hypothetical protein ACRDQW_12860 [Haloechinothrix sp.]